MASTRTTMEALLKDFYLPGVRKTLNDDVFLLSQVEAKSDRVEGLNVITSIATGRNQGIGARGGSGTPTLPTAGNSTIVQSTSGLAYNYGRIQISGPLMRSVQSDRGGFARPLENETKRVVTDLKNDVNRQLYGDGTGALATLTAGTTADDDLTVSLNSVQLRQIVPGMVVDIYSGNTLQASDVVIDVVTSVLISLTTNVTVSNGAKIYRAGSKGNEITGLAAMIAASGTYLNIDPTTVPTWVSTVNANGGTPRAATEDLLMKAWQDAHIASGDMIDLWITTPTIHRAIASDLLGDRRILNTNMLKGGYEGLDVSAAGSGRKGGQSVTVVYDKDATYGKCYGLVTNRIEWQRASDWEFMEEDGAILSRVPNSDAYEATLFEYAQLWTDGRNSMALVSDLTDA